MKSFGIKFIISAVFTVGAAALILLDQHLYAAIACVVAFFLNVPEVKSHSSVFQFANFRVHTLLLGYSVDFLINDGTFWYTLTMFLMSFAGVLRLELFNVFLVKRYTGVEWFGMISMFAVYIFAGVQHPTEWEGWVFPILPMLFMTYIGTSVVIAPGNYARGPRPVSAESAQLGKEAPGFVLPDVNGKDVSLDDFKNKHHVLLIFVRGDWCPTCHIMIREYEINRDKFAEKNIIPIGIGPDSTEVNRAMMERLGWKNMLLSDTKQEIATKYGLLFMNNHVESDYETGIALPASFLIDKNGILRYMSRSDRAGEFLSPSLIFPVIDKLS